MRGTLQDQRELPETQALLGEVEARRISGAEHMTLPFALAPVAGLFERPTPWPLPTPILILEQIGAELQNPFVTRSISHIDVERLCSRIETNVSSAGRFSELATAPAKRYA